MDHVTRGIGGHQSAAARSTVWLTPPEILCELGAFDLDPCAAPEPRPWPTAARHIALPENGLAAVWSGLVWCNPPYGPAVGRWLGRMAEHNNGIALTFARTETTWFCAHAWSRAAAMLFLSHRLNFHVRDGRRSGANAGGPSVLIAWGAAARERLAAARIPGAFVESWRPAR